MNFNRAQMVVAAGEFVAVGMTEIANPKFAEFKLTGIEGLLAIADATLRYTVGTAFAAAPADAREQEATAAVNRVLSYIMKVVPGYIAACAANAETDDLPGGKH